MKKTLVIIGVIFTAIVLIAVAFFFRYRQMAQTIENEPVTDIEVIGQRAGPGYDALETIDRILAKQSPDVDAVSGATGSSKSIMIAVRNALMKNE